MGAAVEVVEASGKEEGGSGKVEIVSKTLFFVVKCGSKIITVTISYFDSNYDRWYYRKRFHIPGDSSQDPKGHTYGPEDPQALPQ